MKKIIYSVKFELGKYEGIAFSPLSKTTFEPDLIILYCDPAQLTQIFIAINWIDGNDVNCRLSGLPVVFILSYR